MGTRRPLFALVAAVVMAALLTVSAGGTAATAASSRPTGSQLLIGWIGAETSATTTGTSTFLPDTLNAWIQWTNAHGGVAVVSTRDCSLQRRHQKLVEEAPAPFLTVEQEAELYRASKAILREAGYVGAGTCEFLIGQDGTISFLEVNTRLQVEHPVTEEVTGIDLVREMLRIAAGEPLGYDDPPARGHAIEFRINAEDAGRGFLPAPGTLTCWHPPSGPGVRVDAGYEQGMTVPQAYDSLLAKLVITGATRTQALERARRALAEFEVQGMPTVLAFHRAVVADPDFTDAPFRVHTRWIETEFATKLEPYAGPVADEAAPPLLERVTVEVAGKRLEVVLPVGLSSRDRQSGPARPAARRTRHSGPAVSGNALTTPMQGTIVKVAVEEGAQVAAGDLVVVLEAMKMEQPLTAPRAGTVRGLVAEVGAVVQSGTVLCEIT